LPMLPEELMLAALSPPMPPRKWLRTWQSFDKIVLDIAQFLMYNVYVRWDRVVSFLPHLELVNVI
jgi:hypothetical protein